MTPNETAFIKNILEPALRNGYGYQLFLSLKEDAVKDGDWDKVIALQDAYRRATLTEEQVCCQFTTSSSKPKKPWYGRLWNWIWRG